MGHLAARPTPPRPRSPRPRPNGGKDDPGIADAAATRVRHLLDTGQIHDTSGTRALLPGDVAVVVPHVSQAALIGAHLADLPDVLVGTANAVQGLEREAVVVVHPLAG